MVDRAWVRTAFPNGHAVVADVLLAVIWLVGQSVHPRTWVPWVRLVVLLIVLVLLVRVPVPQLPELTSSLPLP